MSKYVKWYGFKRNVNSFKNPPAGWAKLTPSERAEAERIEAEAKAARRRAIITMERPSEFERKSEVVLNPINLA